MSSSQSNVFHQNTIKCATCSKPLKLDELGAHVCPKRPSPTLASTPTPPRTPSPLASSRVVSPKSPQASNSRDGQTPTPRAVSPLAITHPQSSPSPLSAPQTVPLSLKRSATENVTSGVNQRNLDAARGSRPPGEMTPPGSPRRSMTTSTRHRGDPAPRPFPVESVISQSGSLQFDFGSEAAGGRDSAVPTLSIHIPDTETGGQAGRAGVGRRAFAAVAQATLLASSYGYHHKQSPPMSPLYSQDFPYGIPSGRLDLTGRGATRVFLLDFPRCRLSRLTRANKQGLPLFQFHAPRLPLEYQKYERHHLGLSSTPVLPMVIFTSGQVSILLLALRYQGYLGLLSCRTKMR